MHGDDSLAILFNQFSPTMVIACVDLHLLIVDAATVATTFMLDASATVAPTVDSTGLNDGNFSKKLVLWYLGCSGCEVFIRL